MVTLDLDHTMNTSGKMLYVKMIILMYARASANATIRTIDEKCANENDERTRRDETGDNKRNETT